MENDDNMIRQAHDSLIETHMKNLNSDDSETLRKILVEKQMLRFPLQITYDLFNATPVHRAFSEVRLEKESDEEFNQIIREQLLSAKFMLDKIFQSEITYP